MTIPTDAREATGSRPFHFEGLPYYSRDEAAVWNWCRRFFRGAPEWRTWIREAWGDLLAMPAGVEICLTQQNSVDNQQESRQHTFRQQEISIGREADNDIAIPTLSVGKRHALMYVENGVCFVKDLGSSLGTYLNEERLPAHTPAVIKNRDTIAIFPHVFTASLKQLWTRQAEVELYPANVEPMSWQAFLSKAGMGRTSFAIEIHPGHGVLCLEAGRAFLMAFVDRLLGPLELKSYGASFPPSDSALLEFVVLSLLERVNRDLVFPFEFDTGICGSRPQYPPDTRGVAITWSLNLLELTGALRIFAPYAVLDAMHRAGPSLPAPPVPAVSWRFPFSIGNTRLSPAEISGLELQDIILFDTGLELLFPKDADRGWKVRQAAPSGEGKSVGAGNLLRLVIDKYFERERLNEADGQTMEPTDAGKPDLSRLPLRLHVILAEKELTLSQVNDLAGGTILELDAEKTGFVSLAINGKILGEGQLVEVEGKLGVKILAWKEV